MAGSLAFAVFPLFPVAPGKTFETFHGAGSSVGLRIINSPSTTTRILAYFTIDEGREEEKCTMEEHIEGERQTRFHWTLIIRTIILVVLKTYRVTRSISMFN